MQQDANQALIKIAGLSKYYGSKAALKSVDLTVGRGEIVGLIGPNGAGKSTLLKAIMGLIKYSGSLTVFGQEPMKNRTKMLESMSYIADVASLPGWMKVSDMLSFVADTHPKFSRSRADELLRDTPIRQQDRIDTLSKGMKTRLHLIAILAIETELLVLDEPTLGLDVLVRRDFQDRLVQDYYNRQRSILVTTHQVDEIESILTRVVFIKEGSITLDIQMDELKTRYCKVVSESPMNFAGLPNQAIYQRNLPSKVEAIFMDADRELLSAHGDVLTPSLEDLFVATNS
ncbi:ABC transporter ATP-binding protein [Arenicella xantha]|uniref:ABC-2 type transport system ATP-binding protein n=1 Tax=Arenicella xantha TaxID=644221 RepID=A0A395JGN0_9GAMM|nr:ABC transporter ATP-binding protein [Arenicella xantha]RBP49140.1 ABC-2 type transport system ATP-binding protein [Arenicella xantha]